MPRITSHPTLLVACPVCCQLHPQAYWGSCEDPQNRYMSAEEYAVRHPEARQPVEVLEFA
jgi:hypothetical protein